MDAVISFIVGLVVSAVLNFALERFGNVGKKAEKLLSVIVRDARLQNEISNKVGLLAIKAGISIIAATPDNDEVQRLLAEINGKVKLLEEQIK